MGPLASAPVSMTADGAAVLAELRRTRRRQRVAEIHWVDAFYQVYITAIISIVAIVLVSGLVGDGEVSGSTLDQVIERGPAVAGLAAAVSLAIGLRSGARGGPLALEAADVRHVLLSPVDRGDALRGPAFDQLRFLAFAGAGRRRGRRPARAPAAARQPAAWLACGAAYGLAVIALGYGAALATSGRRLPGVAGHRPRRCPRRLVGRRRPRPGLTAPATYLGRLALWPLQFDAVALVPVALIVRAPGRRIRRACPACRWRRRSGARRWSVSSSSPSRCRICARCSCCAASSPWSFRGSRPWMRGSSRSPEVPVVAPRAGEACSDGRSPGSLRSSCWRWWPGWRCGERGPAPRR